MTEDVRSRRAILAAGGAALASLGGVAGCTGGGGTSTTPSGESPTTSGTATPAGESGTATTDYTGWIPDPGTLLGSEHTEYLYLGVDRLREYRAALDPGAFTSLESYVSQLASQSGANGDTIRQYLLVGSEGIRRGAVRVLFGDFDPESVASALTDSGYSASTRTDGYAIYTGDGEFAAVGVGPDAIVVPGSSGSAEAVESVVRTGVGDASTYAASNPDFRALVDELERGILVSGGTNPRFDEAVIRVEEPQFVGEVGAGASLRVDGARTNVSYAFVFEDEAVVDTGPVEEWLGLERTEGLVAPFEPGSVEQSGRVVTATGSTETESLFT